VIAGRAPVCAERCALPKTSTRSSNARLCNCPLAMTELAISNWPHVGQAMIMPSTIFAILSAMAPQMGHSMSCLHYVIHAGLAASLAADRTAFRWSCGLQGGVTFLRLRLTRAHFRRERETPLAPAPSVLLPTMSVELGRTIIRASPRALLRHGPRVDAFKWHRSGWQKAPTRSVDRGLIRRRTPINL
jgi:hypothetical protein